MGSNERILLVPPFFGHCILIFLQNPKGKKETPYLIYRSGPPRYIFGRQAGSHFISMATLPLPLSMSQNPAKDQALATLPPMATLPLSLNQTIGLGLQFEFLTLWYIRPFGIAGLQYPQDPPSRIHHTVPRK
jgi:hypothetical protein